MENKMIYPALLNEKDCSADFVECMADSGSVVWNKSKNGEYTGLFFFNNNYVICRYRNTSNSISFTFERWADQKDSFIKMLNEDFFNDESNVVVKIFEPSDELETIALFIYFKPEE